MTFFIRDNSYVALSPGLSGKRSSIMVTAPPVASEMRRAICGRTTLRFVARHVVVAGMSCFSANELTVC